MADFLHPDPKPFYKKTGFWVLLIIIAIFVGGFLANGGGEIIQNMMETQTQG